MKEAVRHVCQRFTEGIALRDILLIILGSVLGPFSLQVLLTPSGLLTGGVAGIAVLIQFVSGIDSWVWYTMINIPVFIAGFRFVSPRFFLYSLLGTGSYAIFLALFSPLSGIWTEQNLLINAILGGLISGTGCGIILKGKGSSGGMDIVAVILRRKWGFQLGEVMLAANLLIILATSFITSVETAFFSGVAMFVSSKMIDRVMMGVDGNKTVMVISKEPEAISRAILMDMHRGCTFLNGEGAYTHENRPVLLVGIYRSQLPLLKEIIFQLDPNAFVITYESNEIYGRGFISSKNDF